MLRKLHAWPALIAGALVAFMALTGAILSLEPVVNAATAPQSGATATSSLADLAAGAAANIGSVQRIVRHASGEMIAYHMGANGPAADVVNASGQSLGAYQPSAFFQFFTELHRAFLSGDTGRIFAGSAAAALIVLSVGGIFLLAKRLGGWSKFFTAAKGTLSQRLHVELSRIGVIILTVLSVTGLWMTLSFFGLIGASDAGFSFPPQSSGTTVMATAQMPALQSVSLADFRELVFPAAGDPTDVFTLTTASGSGYVDQTTGTLLSFAANSPWQSFYQLVYTLHTGQGVWWYALLLGAGALTIPVLFVTGLVMWFRRWRNTVRIRGNARAQDAETIILVGSEGNSTWGFAKTLHAELTAKGASVHVAAMNDLQRHYRSARQLIVMSATYGDGDAPASAKRFLGRLERFEAPDNLKTAVLGFGDRSFADYCGYATKVEATLRAKGLHPLLDFATINRQSAQSFGEWGDALGRALNRKLVLRHEAELPKLQGFVLESRRDYGQDYQTPRSILRFRATNAKSWRSRLGFGSSYEAGDLVGIVPPGSTIPRYYSLSSSSRDGFLEICVSKQPGGVCSTYLCDLQPGDEIGGFLKQNLAFRAPRGNKPLILIGAGTGIAPFVGHLRANRGHRPAYLYWGGRDPSSDFLFRDELTGFRRDGRLAGARIVFSRAVTHRYVQDEVRDDAEFLRESVAKGARILVCGGSSMARGVAEALDEVLAPLKLSTSTLKQTGRLMEDVY